MERLRAKILERIGIFKGKRTRVQGKKPDMFIFCLKKRKNVGTVAQEERKAQTSEKP